MSAKKMEGKLGGYLKNMYRLFSPQIVEYFPFQEQFSKIKVWACKPLVQYAILSREVTKRFRVLQVVWIISGNCHSVVCNCITFSMDPGLVVLQKDLHSQLCSYWIYKVVA